MQSIAEAPLRELAGKVAVITGGSSGIGLGIARACALSGMKVVVTYRTDRHLAEARACLQTDGAHFHAIRLDVSDRQSVVRSAEEAEQVFGGVDLLCINAGVGVGTSVHEATLGDWEYAMNVNVWGAINSVHAFVPRMIARAEPGHVVATSSMAGLFHGGSAGVYTTTKFALVGMMEALRAELAQKRIGVSVFCPGLVKSRIFLANRNRPTQPHDGDRDIRREAERASRIAALMAEGMDPLECGRKVLEGVRRNDMYILTHPEFKQGLSDRCEVLLRSFQDAETVPLPRIRAEESTLRSPVYLREKDRQREVS
jgi:NAD(P)-dependent dehydrogenase (short-subunit alcohol dehydrogenase family)